MNRSRWTEVERVCQAALERPTESRAAFLAEACGDDDTLRREVESLLAQLSRADSFIETPALEMDVSGAPAGPGLTIGQRVGPYHVVSWLGAGGMGEVYRARDADLQRDVALKVLPSMLVGDPERLARFEREARVLASLNHPNVGAIYGLASEGGVRALVLELVDGPTLAERLTQGPLPLGESLTIAMQIAEALEAAHEAGIVHRDLKPANIKITPGGAAKVLDFGLAKLTRAADRGPVDHAPTITVDGTQPGLIIGTAVYMSPEQARGLAVDKRTDIWAFGCVLYEMLTGRRAFEGEDNSAVLARVLERDPNLTLLPANTPSAIRRLLWRCLQKDRKRRLPDIAAARLEIEDAESLPDPAQSTAPPHARRAWVAWAVPGVGLLAAAIAIAEVIRLRHESHNDAPETRFQIEMPDQVRHANLGAFAISPDGRRLAFNGIDDGQLPKGATLSSGGLDQAIRIWVRPLDSLDARPLAGTEGVRGRVFWSPDSRFVVFLAGGKLKKIDVSGGVAQVLCDAPGGFYSGGSWSREGVILFGDGNGVIWRVPEGGGEASAVTPLHPRRPDIGHGFPVFLPDGRHFLFKRWSAQRERAGVYVGSLDVKPDQQGTTFLVQTSFEAGYVPPSGAGLGYLLYRREATLLAQPFNERTLALSGAPISVAEKLGSLGDLYEVNLALSLRANGVFSASANGVLVYRTGSPRNAQLTWFDRQGHAVSQVGDPARYSSVALSPNGSSVAVRRLESETETNQLWLVDLGSGTRTRFTFGPREHCCAVWSPDGRRLAFGTNLAEAPPDESWQVFEKPANSATDERALVNTNGPPWDWSHDGRFLLYGADDPKTHRGDIWILPLEADGKPQPFLAGAPNEYYARFSPDGHWIVYTSNESGQDEIYVREFTPNGAGGKWLVSKGGAQASRWRGDGKELFYNAPDGALFVVDVTTVKGEFRAGTPKLLFNPGGGTTIATTGVNEDRWDVTADGARFLVALQAERSLRTPFTVVQNWQAGLKK